MLFSCSVTCEEQTPHAICASNNLFEITPESVRNKLKNKGMYNMIICLFNNLEFYMFNGYMAL